MFNRLRQIAAAAAVSLVIAGPASAGELSDADLVTLQVAMQSYIDSVRVDDAVLKLDPAKRKVVALYPTKAHPEIMVWDDKIVMCANFVDAEGRPEMANFYLAKSGDKYVVFATTWGHDEVLEALMKKGKAAMAN